MRLSPRSCGLRLVLDEQRRIAAILVFFLAAMIFWAIFEQAGLSIALFADQLTLNEIAGIAFPSAWYLALNSLFVILLAPLFAALWTRLGQAQPSSPVKFALGLGFLASSFLLMVPAALLTAPAKSVRCGSWGFIFYRPWGNCC